MDHWFTWIFIIGYLIWQGINVLSKAASSGTSGMRSNRGFSSVADQLQTPPILPPVHPTANLRGEHPVRWSIPQTQRQIPAPIIIDTPSPPAPKVSNFTEVIQGKPTQAPSVPRLAFFKSDIDSMVMFWQIMQPCPAMHRYRLQRMCCRSKRIFSSVCKEE